MLHYHSNSTCLPGNQYQPKKSGETIRMFLNITINDSGGGGGGATYIFVVSLFIHK